MAPHIEANSLSDITQLASNLPKYPRNPTEQKRNPLTLYIARVPGSKDIILTTLKPQVKNVTAADVASSLYYFHLNTEEDAELLEDDSSVILEEEEPSDAKQKPLPRKPLPESAKSSLDISRHVPITSVSVSVSNPQRQISRKALPSLPAEKQTPTQTQISTAPTQTPTIPTQTQTPPQVKDHTHRRPLGPRPLLSDSTGYQDSHPEVENKSLASRAEVLGTSTPYNPNTVSYEYPQRHDPELSNLKTSPEPAKSFSITIIRRDPSSGAQWNVGEVIGEQQNVAVKPASSRKPFFDISVLLTTPGYTQFRGPQNTPNSAGGQLHGSGPLHKEVPGFYRQIRMEGSNFWDRREHKRSQSSDTVYHSPTRNAVPISPVDKPDDHTDPITGSKGYTFTSPWGGRCKFTTSSSGRTLRCKHTLPGPISSSNSSSTSSSQTACLSELRFNLPSLLFHNHTHSSPKSSRSPEHSRFHAKIGHIRNKLSPDKILRPPLPARPSPSPDPTSFAALCPSDDEGRPSLPPRPGPNPHTHPVTNTNPYISDSSDEVDEGEDRLDLSIGQEKAGGGNRGSRAKLGKLIVLDEGFKMLDLVVAANMGVWWSVWESNT